MGLFIAISGLCDRNSLPKVGRVRRSRERVRYNRIGVKSDTPSALCATSPILGEELVFFMVIVSGL